MNAPATPYPPTAPQLCAMDTAAAAELLAAATRYRAHLGRTGRSQLATLSAAGALLGVARARMDAPIVWRCAPLFFSLSVATARRVTT